MYQKAALLIVTALIYRGKEKETKARKGKKTVRGGDRVGGRKRKRGKKGEGRGDKRLKM